MSLRAIIFEWSIREPHIPEMTVTACGCITRFSFAWSSMRTAWNVGRIWIGLHQCRRDEFVKKLKVSVPGEIFIAPLICCESHFQLVITAPQSE